MMGPAAGVPAPAIPDRGRGGHRSARPARRRAWLLFVVSLVVYNANLREISSADTIPTRLLPVAVILDHRLTLDRYYGDGQETPYWIQHAGTHAVSAYPTLPALLAVPVYLVPILVWGDGSWALLNLLAKLSASLLAALSVVVLHRAACRLAPPAAATGVALVYAFGTSTWAVSSQGLWGHAPAQLFMVLAVDAMLRGDAAARFVGQAGVAAGLMVASRPATGLVAAALVGYALVRHRCRGILALLGVAGVLVPVVVYNVWQFGSVQGGYATLHATHATYHGVPSAWAGSLAGGLLGLLVSPSRGLLVYSPVLFFALAGLCLAVARWRPPLLGWLAAATAATIVALARFSVWWGGHSFGPRLLTDVLPVLALLLVPIWPALRRSRPLQWAFASLLAVSIGIQAIGAFYHPSPRESDWNTAPRDVDAAHERLWDWRDAQLPRLLANGPRSPGFR